MRLQQVSRWIHRSTMDCTTFATIGSKEIVGVLSIYRFKGKWRLLNTDRIVSMRWDMNGVSIIDWAGIRQEKTLGNT
jgi:hypothetical protein